jgi:uncharacterized membrane protein
VDDNVIAAWFPAAAPGNAHDGLEALVRLDEQGTVKLHRAGVVERGADGKLAISEKAHRSWKVGTAAGGVIGALVGVVGGPLGVAVGAGAGALLGAGAESGARRHAIRMLDVVHAHPEAGAVLLLAELSEPSTEAVDQQLARLGAEVTRRSVFDVERELGESKHPG